jgi:uncharacterized membrane protein
MPYFRVRVDGKNISVPMGDATAVGFFATRAVRARSADEAVEKVRSMIITDWTIGRYAAWNKGNAPTILIEDVWLSPWFRNILFKNDGHAFYPDDAGEDEA